MPEDYAQQDFERAKSRAAWRKILSRLTGANNQLLPYDEVRARLPLRGQHYIGMRDVPINLIIGSMGRYNDFDRAFLPIQDRTKQRWMNIDRAHYDEVYLPPVELTKLGDVYFVKDGNHRISVARERGQEFVEAYVTEVDIPIKLTQNLSMDDLASKKGQAEFMLASRLNQARPEAEIELSNPQLYPVLEEHIRTHRWYMSKEQGRELPETDAAASWYDHVYLALIQVIQEQGLLKAFNKQTEADLYLWITEYQKYLRQAYTMDEDSEELIRRRACDQLVSDYPEPDITRLIQAVDKAGFLEDLMLKQERTYFLEQTHLDRIRSDFDLSLSMPGKYDSLLEHIATHRWFMGERRQAEVTYQEAVASWYDNVYLPIVHAIREQNLLAAFPARTETDLYIWIIRRQWLLKEALDEEMPFEDVASSFVEQPQAAQEKPVFQKIQLVLRKAFRKK